MINWDEIKSLHVISKLEQVISKWFGVEIFYVDENNKIRSSVLEKDYEFNNHLFKLQMHLSYGHEYLNQDIEKVTDSLQNEASGSVEWSGYFKGIRGFSARISYEGEYLGSVFGYPFLEENVTSDELKELKAQLNEAGADEEDIERALNGLKRVQTNEKEYLKELVELVAEEIVTFHSEIEKREDRINELNSELGNKYRYHNMIGKSREMQQIYRLLEKVSKTDSTVLIQGENGTGKELVAKAIHYNSQRKDHVFIAQNCSAFNDNLLDSELFGHVKGAFTGAVKDKKGLFEAANGGTLFLDEVGDTSPSMQVKLLRVLQEGTFLPVGATQPRKVNVRVLAATNRDLKGMIAKGEFREDLYYRINVINVSLPPLRDRKEDIPLLVDSFLEKRCGELGVATKVLSKKCFERVLNYNWPGNIRELLNEIERLVVLAGEDKNITPDLLSPKISEGQVTRDTVTRGVNTSGGLKSALEDLEKLMIREGLKRCNFNKSRLAKELGISRAGLIMKVDKYGLDKRKRAAGE